MDPRIEERAQEFQAQIQGLRESVQHIRIPFDEKTGAMDLAALSSHDRDALAAAAQREATLVHETENYLQEQLAHTFICIRRLGQRLGALSPPTGASL